MDIHQRMAEDFDRVIVRDDTSSSVTEDDPHLEHFRSVRERLLRVLEGYKFQLIMVFLVIFDCLLVISELLIDIRVLELQEGHGRSTVVIHALSVSILSVFLVEIAVKLYAFHFEFFRLKLEIFDAFVVIATFSLDIAFRECHSAVNGVGLLIILRLWRVARILNGVVMTVKVQAERHVYRERREREALEEELNKYRDYCLVQEQEIEALLGLLRKHGIEVGQLEERPVSGVRVDVVAEVNEGTEGESLRPAAT